MSWEAAAWAMRKGKDYELEPVTRFVMLTLANYADKEGNDIYPSLGTLEADTGLSERTIRRHIKTLIGVGLLDYGDQAVVKANPRIRADQRPKVYRFLFERDEAGAVDFGGFAKLPSARQRPKQRPDTESTRNDRTESPAVPVDNSPEPAPIKAERPDSVSITTGHTTGHRVHQTIKALKENQEPASPPPTADELEAGRRLRAEIRERNATRGTFALVGRQAP